MSEREPTPSRGAAADDIEELFSRYVEHHVVHGERQDLDTLCADHPRLLEPLRALVQRYEQIEEALTVPERPTSSQPEGVTEEPLPSFEGFRTIEHLGRGGGGNVYKLQDLALGRLVAGKVMRRDSPLTAGIDGFLREARSLALFDDPYIVRLLELRQSDPPVLLMEYVDGFDLAQIGGSLEFSQRARVVAEIADALHRAHELGLQHRDLKPGNVLLDATLQPKILDFGLCRGEPDRGHGVGTLAYMAPEQLDPTRPIDARTDVHALGVMLYELLCGTRPYRSETEEDLAAAINQGEPRLPVEIEPTVPEPLQAIALKAMEVEPADRYASAREMALELKRYLEGRPVLARPRLYRSALDRRLQPHLQQVREWRRIRLIHPHEADRLEAAYGGLESREDDWIVQSRNLSLSQIALYLGAFALACGSLLYFAAYLMESQPRGWLLESLLVLGLPFACLNVAARMLYHRDRQAVAVAFHLGAAALLPPLLLILFREAGWWPPAPDGALELFEKVSNRQLQVACLASCAWAAWLAVRTRTVALSTGFTVLACFVHLTVLADLGLRRWLEDGSWDTLALHLVPLLLLISALGRWLEVRGLPWFAQPLYLGGVVLLVAVAELLALNGRAFAHLGLTLAPLQDAGVSDPRLLDTVAAMTLNGMLIYTAGWVLYSRGTGLMKTAAWILFTLSPFTILEPLAYLNEVGEYSRRFDWLFLALALSVTFLSHHRQRKSFYYAGLINTSVSLWLITEHYDWYDRPAWGIAVVAVSIVTLATGYALHVMERTRRHEAPIPRQ